MCATQSSSTDGSSSRNRWLYRRTSARAGSSPSFAPASQCMLPSLRFLFAVASFASSSLSTVQRTSRTSPFSSHTTSSQRTTSAYFRLTMRPGAKPRNFGSSSSFTSSRSTNSTRWYGSSRSPLAGSFGNSGAFTTVKKSSGLFVSTTLTGRSTAKARGALPSKSSFTKCSRRDQSMVVMVVRVTEMSAQKALMASAV